MVTLRLDGIGAGYGASRILSDITTPTFEAGEVVAVIGPNGAGKSTLFKRIAGLLPGPGAVWLQGAASALAICYMPQDTACNTALSVFEAVMLARKQGSSLRVSERDLVTVDETLAVLGIAALSARSVGDLSGGQRQLVGIAQALVRAPEILLMDEPTSALDLHRQVEVLSLVRRLAKERNMIILIALHDLNQVLRFSDQAMVIAEGGLHACGAVEHIVTPSLLKSVYQVEARIEACSRGQRHVIVDGMVPPTQVLAITA
ncbi:ABC transporter ATP-binding protein [Marinobacterium aestuariivivens]|uniref:ABC transporter ATP-binding protein n=1 Tax=Marinobacterium aestuariivivens TaxID=1698799 RepID=A0ABW2A7F0_9GAMM